MVPGVPILIAHAYAEPREPAPMMRIRGAAVELDILETVVDEESDKAVLWLLVARLVDS